MFSIFICTSCGVMETLVWVLQAHVQSSISELLNRVDASVTFSVFDILEVVVVVGAVVVVDLLEVVEVVREDKTMFVVWVDRGDKVVEVFALDVVEEVGV